MPKKARGLGRGLDILLPELAPEAGETVQQLSLTEIDPDPQQPRKEFDPEALEQLAQSMRSQGVLQPLLVTPFGSRYRLVAGERRFRAARLAGLDTVPCLVRTLTDAQRREMALVENLQREDLNPLEAALGLQALLDETRCTQAELAQRLGMARSQVANLLRLPGLPQPVLEAITAGQLSLGHAKVLAGLGSTADQLRYGLAAAEAGWSVRALEDAIRRDEKAALRRAPVKRVLSPELSQLEDALRETTGLRTVLTGTEKKGRIVLQYYSQEELERLWELLQRMGDV